MLAPTTDDGAVVPVSTPQDLTRSIVLAATLVAAVLVLVLALGADVPYERRLPRPGDASWSPICRRGPPVLVV